LGKRLGKEELYQRAHRALNGVGDAARGEWLEWSGYAFHVRRRLAEDEQFLIGPVVDLRGTDQGWRRFTAIKEVLNPAWLGLAVQELGISLAGMV
jgi:hypothetical protein